MFFGHIVFKLCAHGAKEAIAGKNTKKRTNKRCRNVVAQNFRRFVDLAHGQNHAQHAGHNTHARQ